MSNLAYNRFRINSTLVDIDYAKMLIFICLNLYRYGYGVSALQ